MARNKYGNFKCANCNGYNLELHVGWDGMDEESEAGEGSGFNTLVALCCNDCGRAYPICRVRKISDVSDLRIN